MSLILYSLSAMVECYIGLGGNFIETLSVMRQVAAKLKNDPELKTVHFSSLYRTTPVSPIPQAPYLNAVCYFQTDLCLDSLWNKLQTLEKDMGKQPKNKNAPRLIDLDLLFYGSTIVMTHQYIIPHPRWHERLFVLVPLAELTDKAPLEGEVNIKKLLECFSNPHQEKIYREGRL